MNQEFNAELYERAKELACMYRVDDVLQDTALTLPAAMRELTTVIPVGFSVPEACRAQILLWDKAYAGEGFDDAEILLRVAFPAGEDETGEIAVGYMRDMLPGECALLHEEERLLETIAHRVSQRALDARRELSLTLDTLGQVDPAMLLQIGEKLRVHLKTKVGAEADALFAGSVLEQPAYGETNTPLAKPAATDIAALRRALVAGAAAFLPQGEAQSLITGWIQEQRLLDLVKIVDGKDARISDILDAVRKYSEAAGALGAASPTEKWLTAELAHRFLADDEDMMNLVLDNLHLSDFADVLGRLIGSDTSRGNIGGKGAGLFIARQILRRAAERDPLFAQIRTPRTWYLATDVMVDFLHYNKLEELNSYKYHSTLHLRITYDSIVTKLKNAKLPPRIVQMLRVVLEEMGDVPLIVRSSSLLEDRQAGAFSGKYKSLFLHNQGSRAERLDALTDAILEVYSSMYNPDALQYRKERGLLNISEQMGILIQEVVGRHVGKYFLPAFAGVAFSNNLFRWSARIRREEGLVRMVMGLGTRAVDRVNDDYPFIFSPGQPELPVNLTPADIRHYSPKRIDLINLEEQRFETVDALAFLRENGAEFPNLHRYVSVFRDDFLEEKNAFGLDPKRDDMVVTFRHTLAQTDLAGKLRGILRALSEKMATPVDVEFAFDGDNLYLLQCRPQSGGISEAPAPIPQNLPPRDILFTAHRYVTDGAVRDITHLVYVDGEAYHKLSSREELYAVGEAVGMLNETLPRRKFILMGPGRWGSRGDIKLGVRVTYSDISATAALIEIAEEKRSYMPELSFGTHFFQDLVEAGIVYLPLYPNDADTVFQSSFFHNSVNLLPSLLPQYGYLADVIKVIDIPASRFGRTLALHMNAELEQAVAFLATADSPSVKPSASPLRQTADMIGNDHWSWRHYMAKQVAQMMEMERFGVRGVYLFGSTASGEAGMGSDIDLLVHLEGEDAQPHPALQSWLDGWSRALARINYLQTGYAADSLLDVHFISDRELRDGDSFAMRIGSFTDPAEPLRVRQ